MAESQAKPPKLLTALFALGAVCFLITLYLAFAVAPIEKTMGIAQKIFYFHAPIAYGMYIGYGVSAVASLVYLTKRDDRWDALAISGAEVGTMLYLLVMTTGPLWARKAWGVWWTWDPRLTSMFLAGLIFLSYLVLRSFGSVGEVERKFAAGLAVLGGLDLVVVHYAVQLWRGTHPTVITKKGGGLAPDMYPAFFMGLFTLTLLSIALIWIRARTERVRQRALALELMAAERGLLEEV